MSAFTRLDGWAFWLGDGIDYVARAALPWDVGAKGSGLRLVVPVGFVFNTSIPNLLRWIFNPHDKLRLTKFGSTKADVGLKMSSFTSGASAKITMSGDFLG